MAAILHEVHIKNDINGTKQIAGGMQSVYLDGRRLPFIELCFLSLCFN